MKNFEQFKRSFHHCKLFCAMFILAFFSGCNKEITDVPSDIPIAQLPSNIDYLNYPFKNTEWKLLGFANLSDSTFRYAMAPNDLLDFSYKLRFETDSTFTGTTSSNTIFGDYSSDFALGTLSIIGFWGSKRGEEYDGKLYRESIKLVETYTISEFGLQLYIHSGTKYLLYTPVSH